MGEAGGVVEIAAKAAEPVISQAAGGNVSATVFVLIVGLLALAGVYVWRMPNDGAAAGTHPPTPPTGGGCGPNGCSEIRVAVAEIRQLSSDVRHLNTRFDESQHTREIHYTRFEDALSRLDDRIGEQTPRREHDAAMMTFHHSQEETNRLLRGLLDKVT